MKVCIDVDEMYPVYFLVANDGTEDVFDVPPEQLERWRDAEGAFAAAQAEMATVRNAQT